MPLRVADSQTNPQAIKSFTEKYVIFYSSIVDGQLWCPDCLDVEKLIKETFEPENAPSAAIVYVGNRSEWKSSLNPFRGEPWNVSSIPTIIEVEDHIEVARLVEGDIESGLRSFLEK